MDIVAAVAWDVEIVVSQRGFFGGGMRESSADHIFFEKKIVFYIILSSFRGEYENSS